MNPVVHIGSDHLGYQLKATIMSHLAEKGIQAVDEGCPSPERTDYPIYAEKVARAVAHSSGRLGIVICGSGAGVSISANKVAGARCCLCSDTYTARMTRAHNDANVLALGALVVGPGLARDIVDAFLEATFEGGRHQRRVDMIAAIQP